MNKLSKVTLLLAFAVGSFGVYSGAQEAPETLATNHVLKGTYINNGDFGGVVSSETWTPIDTQLTVPCPGSSGTCTIQADMLIQNGGEGAFSSPDYFEICFRVDGNPSSGFCSGEAGVTPTDGTFLESSSSQAATGLAPGNHTVQTYFNSVFGAHVFYYSSTYRVYKP
jgi:hypothetical protein